MSLNGAAPSSQKERRPLPPLKCFNGKFLGGAEAPLIRKSLQKLHAISTNDRSEFVDIFGKHPFDLVGSNRARDNWARNAECREAVSILIDNGILSQEYAHSPFLITLESSGFFYVTDRPDTGHWDEVFSLHLEQRVLSSRQLARPNDTVLDLGTGCGFLLLEAVRRGARGLGIDISKRALEFAALNASLNGVADRVAFQLSDMTSQSAKVEWGKPDLVISNPPFDPTLPGASIPIHSDAGPLGDKVLSSMLMNLSDWSHRPAAIQLVLYSLASTRHRNRPIGANSENRSSNPENLHLWSPIREFAEITSATVQAHEIAAPMSVADFLEQHHGNRDSRQRNAWLSEVKKKLNLQESARSINVHLFVADIFLNDEFDRYGQMESWASWRADRMGEEGFILPIVADRHFTNSEVFYKYFRSIHATRLQNHSILAPNFKDVTIQKVIKSVIRDMLIAAEEFCVIFLNAKSAEQGMAHVLWFYENAFKQTKCMQVSKEDLIALVSNNLNLAGATVCEFYSIEPFVRTHVQADLPRTIIETLFLIENEVQRLAVVSSWPNGCATQARQAALANLFLSVML